MLTAVAQCACLWQGTEHTNMYAVAPRMVWYGGHHATPTSMVVPHPALLGPGRAYVSVGRQLLPSAVRRFIRPITYHPPWRCLIILRPVAMAAPPPPGGGGHGHRAAIAHGEHCGATSSAYSAGVAAVALAPRQHNMPVWLPEPRPRPPLPM